MHTILGFVHTNAHHFGCDAHQMHCIGRLLHTKPARQMRCILAFRAHQFCTHAAGPPAMPLMPPAPTEYIPVETAPLPPGVFRPPPPVDEAAVAMERLSLRHWPV
jgi:hypothetical protein